MVSFITWSAIVSRWERIGLEFLRIGLFSYYFYYFISCWWQVEQHDAWPRVARAVVVFFETCAEGCFAAAVVVVVVKLAGCQGCPHANNQNAVLIVAVGVAEIEHAVGETCRIVRVHQVLFRIKESFHFKYLKRWRFCTMFGIQMMGGRQGAPGFDLVSREFRYGGPTSCSCSLVEHSLFVQIVPNSGSGVQQQWSVFLLCSIFPPDFAPP